MLGDALGFPRSSDDWIQTVLIGGALVLFGFFVVPGIIVQGYTVRVLERAGRPDAVAPSFTEWGDLFVDGLKAFAINLIYSIPLIVLYVALLFVVAGAGSVDPGSGAGAGLGVVSLGLGLAFLAVGLAVAFVVPAATANFAREDSFGAAFDLGTIRRGALSGSYVKAWLLALVVGVVLGTLFSFLAVLLVGIPLLFYLQVVLYYLFGRGFAEGLDAGRTVRTESAPTESF
jgi:hypothetical protein